MFDIKQVKKGRKVIVQTTRKRLGIEHKNAPIIVEIIGKVKGSQTLVNVKEIDRGIGWNEEKKLYSGYLTAWRNGFPYFKLRRATSGISYEGLFEPTEETELRFTSWSRGENYDFGEEFEVHCNFIQKFDKDVYAKMFIKNKTT